MCPICELFGLGGLALLFGPDVARRVGGLVARLIRRPLPLTFSATPHHDTRGGWQSAPPILRT